MEIYVCDKCKNEILGNAEAYTIKYNTGGTMGYALFSHEINFCEGCYYKFRDVLKKFLENEELKNGIQFYKEE